MSMTYIESNPERNDEDERAEQEEISRTPHLVSMTPGEFEYFTSIVARQIESDDPLEQAVVKNEQ